MTHQISAISYAVHSALLIDLKPVEEFDRVWSFEEKKQIIDKANPRLRRPHEGEVSIYSFPQSFSNTTLGFGGVGGQAFTTAQMTVVICQVNACVYVNGRKAYSIDHCNDLFFTDLGNHNLSSAIRGKSHYEMRPNNGPL